MPSDAFHICAFAAKLNPTATAKALLVRMSLESTEARPL